MRHVVASILTVLLALTATAQSSKSTPSSSLSFLKSYKGKSPQEVGLFKQKAFTSRLRQLLGLANYAFLEKNWHVQMPMEYAGNLFVAEACQRHSCGFTDFMVVYDFAADRLYAGIRKDRVPKTYAEKGAALPQSLVKWTKDPYKN